ncbi:unnamed protein product, partial [Ilex paraguariensis]
AEAEQISILDDEPINAPNADQSKGVETLGNGVPTYIPFTLTITYIKAYQASESSPESTRQRKHIAKKRKVMEISESDQAEEM